MRYFKKIVILLIFCFFLTSCTVPYFQSAYSFYVEAFSKMNEVNAIEYVVIDKEKKINLMNVKINYENADPVSLIRSLTSDFSIYYEMGVAYYTYKEIKLKKNGFLENLDEGLLLKKEVLLEKELGPISLKKEHSYNVLKINEMNLYFDDLKNLVCYETNKFRYEVQGLNQNVTITFPLNPNDYVEWI